MSWHRNYKTKAEFYTDSPEYYVTQDLDEYLNQVGIARKVAQNILESGTVGRLSEHEFVINLSGQANPKHEPTARYAQDTITVSVTQRI